MKNNVDTIASLLRKSEIFRNVDYDHLKQAAKKLRYRVYKARQHIFYKDDPGIAMYFIESGQVRVYVNSNNGNEASIAMFSDGQVFGEIALLDNETRSTNAITITETSCHLLHREVFDELVEAHPQISRNMIRFLTKRVRTTVYRFEGLVLFDITQRVCRTLLRMADERGIELSNGNIEINLVLRDAHIASMIGASRESVNRVFRNLRNLEIIDRTANRTVITDVQYLHSFID